MLSRIAESLFWIGRYVERAEDTARILDVNIHHLLEAPLAGESEICRSLLAIMGVRLPDNDGGDGSSSGGGGGSSSSGSGSGGSSSSSSEPEAVTARRVTDILVFDERNPSSIVSSLVSARANARGVSDAISSEMWEALNVTYNQLAAQVKTNSRAAPYGFFRFVRERAAIVEGLTESTMSRDDAWRFLVLGRSLERIDMLTRLLLAVTTSRDPDWVVLLRSFSAHEAFLRTYRREPDGLSATEFLLLDRLFPRSLFSSLSRAEECLAELDPRSGRAGMPDEGRRVLGHLRTNLEFRTIDDLLDDLPGLLLTIQKGCWAASAALATRYFRQTAAIEWSVEVVGVDI